MPDLDVLADMEYPGRFIIIGRDYTGCKDVILYGVTARSPPNQARKIIDEGSTVRVDASDPEAIKGADPMLVLYNCIRIVNGNIVVSNGRQTDLIADTIQKSLDAGVQPTALGSLVESSERPYLVETQEKGQYIDLTKFEPDAPTNTPRISAVVTRDGSAISIVRSIPAGLGDKSLRSFFEIPSVKGWGRMISTYTGQNVPSGTPIPSFRGEPCEVQLPHPNPVELAIYINSLLRPKAPREEFLAPGKDFRVAVVAMFYDRNADKVETYVVNRHA